MEPLILSIIESNLSPKNILSKPIQLVEAIDTCYDCDAPGCECYSAPCDCDRTPCHDPG